MSTRTAVSVPRTGRGRFAAGLWLAVLAGAALAPASVSAQLHAEVRGGLTVGSHSASAAALDIAPAMSFDVVVKRQMMPSLAIFGGFFRTSFGCEEGFCRDRDIMVVGNHGALGAEWSGGVPWVRAGLLFGTTEAGTEGEAPEAGMGFHAAAGLSVGSGRFRFLPGVSYRWLSASTASTSDRAVALTLDLGFGIRISGGVP